MSGCEYVGGWVCVWVDVTVWMNGCECVGGCVLVCWWMGVSVWVNGYVWGVDMAVSVCV